MREDDEIRAVLAPRRPRAAPAEYQKGGHIMSTGNFTNWDGNMLDLGPLYPFVGWEGFMVVLAFIFWIGWHILQMRAENKQHEEQARMLRQGGDLAKAVDAEHPVERF